MKRIIGMGTGRCGTKTLAKLLDGCEDYDCIHEPKPHLPWEVDEHKVQAHLNSQESCVALFYAKYWNFFDDVLFIVLQRNKEDTVQSFLDVTAVNDRWSEPNNEHWDHMFPSYSESDKRDSIERYYDEYYEMMPDDALWVKTENLSDKDTQERIFDYAAIPENKRVYEDIVANKREDHHGYIKL